VDPLTRPSPGSINRSSNGSILPIIHTPRSIIEIINGVDDLSTLKMLHKKSATVESLDEFRRVLEKALS